MALCSVSVVINRHEAKHDYNVWYPAGQAVLHGADFYDVRPGQQIAFMYPPAAAWLLAPTTIAGEQAMTAILGLLNSAAWWLCIVLSVYLVTGRAPGSKVAAVAVIPSLLAFPHIWETYILGQPNLLLLACMLAGFVFLRWGRQYAAGAAFALAASIKAFPILVLPYLVYRRSWRALAGCVVTLALLLYVIPATFRGPARSWNDLKTWSACMLHVDAGGIGQRAERSYSWQNQSLIGVAHRLLRHVDANRARQGSVYVNFVNLTFRQANLIVLIVGVSLGIGFLVLLRYGRHREELQPGAIELAMLLVLILIASPYMFGYFNVWLLFPYTVLVDACANDLARRRFPLSLIALTLCPLLYVFSMQFKIFWHLQMLGNMFWGNLTMLGILAVEMMRPRAAPDIPLNFLQLRPARTGVAAAAPSAAERRLRWVRSRPVQFVGLAAFALVLALVGGLVLWNNVVRRHYLPTRFGVVEPGRLYRSGQISAELIRPTLVEYHIKLIIDLSVETTPDAKAECQTAADLGIKRISMFLGGSGVGNPDVYPEAIADIVRANRRGEPVLIHCQAGTQRTGGVVAVYRILIERMSEQSALAEAECYGYRQTDNPRLVAFIEHHLPEWRVRLTSEGILPASLARADGSWRP